MPLVAGSVADLARAPELRVALDWFRRERAWINEQHLKLCRVPAPTFLEQKRAEWMAERFQSLGWESRLDRSGNVVASLPGRRDSHATRWRLRRTWIRCSRPARRTKSSFPATAGSWDPAFPIMAPAWPRCWRWPRPGTQLRPCRTRLMAPLLVANVGEEGEGNLSGMRYLCRDSNGSRPKAFLVLDGPNTDHITCRALASRRFEVAVTGPGGHSWSDYGAGNPVHALSRAIADFATRRHRPIPRPGPPSTSV